MTPILSVLRSRWRRWMVGALAVGGIAGAAAVGPEIGPSGPLVQLSPICQELTSGGSTADGTSVATPAVTPGANRLIVAAVVSAGTAPPAPSLSGNGLVWVQVATVPYALLNARRLSVYRAMGAAPTLGAITANFAGTQTSFLWSVIECSPVDTSGANGAGAVVQSTTNSGLSLLGATNTLAAPLSSPLNVHLAFIALDNANGISLDLSFLGLGDVSIGTPASALNTQWAVNEQSVSTTFLIASVGMISVEVAAP